MSAKKGRENERGVALILVLGAIAILTVMLTRFSRRGDRRALGGARRSRRAQGRVPGQSGVNSGRLLIASPSPPSAKVSRSSLGGRAAAPGVGVLRPHLGRVQRQGGGRDFARSPTPISRKGKNLGINGGRFEVNIVDEDSKLNVNIAARGEPFTQLRVSGAAHVAPRGRSIHADVRAARPRRQLHRSRRRRARAHRLGRRERRRFSYDPDQRGSRHAGRRGQLYQLLKCPTFARTRRTTASKSSTWCAGQR